MARRIPFTKAMHEAVRWVAPQAQNPAMMKSLQELADRMDAASVPLEASGMSTKDLVDILKAAGCTIAMPPRPSRAWWDKIHRAIRDAGLDVDSALLVARAASRLRQPVTLEQVAYRISALLAQETNRAQASPPSRANATSGWTRRREFESDSEPDGELGEGGE